MTTVLAAIDDSTAAGPVLAAARAVASLLDCALDTVHVQEGDKQTATAVAEHLGCSLRLLQGDPVAEIIRASRDPEVLLVVLATSACRSSSRRASRCWWCPLTPRFPMRPTRSGGL